MTADRWLDPWLPLIAERAGDAPVLELGCGGGRDAATLAHAGFQVVGMDKSRSAVTEAGIAAPSCTFHCRDIRDPFPSDIDRVGVVVASLSLHYFTWHETGRLVSRIHAVLQTNGLLLCRLNSTNDYHFGATGHPEIEANYYLVNGQPKRFFDRSTVETLFARKWKALHLEEKIIHRYDRPKSLWELVVEKVY